MDVVDPNGEFNLLHSTVPKKGQTEGNEPLKHFVDKIVQYKWVPLPEDAPFRIVPYNTKKKSGSFTLTTSSGTLKPVSMTYTCASASVCLLHFLTSQV